jgi:hypothetical protein
MRKLYLLSILGLLSISTITGQVRDQVASDPLAATVTVNVSLSCTAQNTAYTSVALQNTSFPDTVYQALMDASGTLVFPAVYMGYYTLTVMKFGYTTWTQTPVLVEGNSILNVSLMQVLTPPSNLTIDNKSLIVSWSPPKFSTEVFAEGWTSGSLATNGWITSGGTNWQILPAYGNPSPSIMFNWSPHVDNYHQYLTSKNIEGVHSPVLKLNFDIALVMYYYPNTENWMSVELWDGSSWQILKTYSNRGNFTNFTFLSESLDISAYTNGTFNIRFHASGGDSYDIEYWNIDNISIVASEADNGTNPCVINYGFYLNNTLIGSPIDANFQIPYGQLIYGQMNSVCVSAVYSNGSSSHTCDTLTSHFLCPPTELTVIGYGDEADLSWHKPQCEAGAANGLIGYTIYRSEGGPGGPWLRIIHLAGPDSLYCVDGNPVPGMVCYRVTAYYDLTVHGFPGQFDESSPDGPECATLHYGTTLPFCEHWDGGSFASNNWRFGASGSGNWIFNTGVGVPSPSADFSWIPIRLNYSYDLEKTFDATAWTCAKIWLDFDFKLVDRNITSNEKMTIEIYYDNAWHQVEELVNGGNVDWTRKHYDISDVMGKGFKLRLSAHGVNSADFLHWYIDNICVYGNCKPPIALRVGQIKFTTILTWLPPICSNSLGSLIWDGLDDGSAETGKSIAPGTNAWIGNHYYIGTGNNGVIKKVRYYFMNNSAHGTDKLTIDFFSGYPPVLLGSTAPFIVPNDAWDSITVNDIPFTNGVYAMVHWNKTSAPTNLIGYDENGPNSLLDLEKQFDGTTWSQLSSTNGSNPGVCMIRIKILLNGSMKTIEINPSDGSVLTGYDVFRTQNLYVEYGQPTPTPIYSKINTSILTGTTYSDVHPIVTEPGAIYKYFVKDVFNNSIDNTFLCDASTDTVVVNWPATGFKTPGSCEVVVYPNPATDQVNIESTSSIKSVDVMNFTGQSVFTCKAVNDKTLHFNVSMLSAGVYLVKIISGDGVYATKIIVTK